MTATIPAHPVFPAPSTFGTLFRGQPIEHVHDAHASATWMLAQIAAAPDAYAPAVREVFDEVRAEAAHELDERKTHPVPSTPLTADLDRAKERVDLAGYIESRTGARFRRAGHELVARCVFPNHEDRTPSFRLNEAKGVFHCHGCGRGGDIVTFLMAWDGISFREAALSLLWEAGLPVPASTPAPVATGMDGGPWQPTPVRGGGRRGY